MSRASRSSSAAALVVGSAVLLAGCALHVPAVRESPLRSEAPVARFELPTPSGAWPDATWWRRYGDPTLDALIALSLEGAPGLKVADARFAAARQSVRVAGAALGVQVEASGDLSRQRLSDNGLISPSFLGFNWYNQADLGIEARYSFDWWGRQKAGIEAAVDAAHAAEAERAAARIELASAVAQAYLGWQLDQQRLALARERVAVVERLVHVTELRVAAQLENPDARRIATMGQATTREQIAGLEGSARLRVVALAALAGRRAEELPPLLPRPLPPVARALPDSVRLDLVSRRPDIVASRWRVEAARQDVAAVRAEYYPDVSLRALVGLSSVEIGKLLQGGSAVPSLGAAIHLPLFDAGLRDARHGAREAEVDAAVADYDATVIAAARDVATAVSTGAAIAAQREQRDLQLVESRAFADSAAARARGGTADVRPELAARLSVNLALDALMQLDFAALSADIALQRALGGGYLAMEQQP
jgi:multidrug efflux system outer membrane protein